MVSNAGRTASCREAGPEAIERTFDECSRATTEDQSASGHSHQPLVDSAPEAGVNIGSGGRHGGTDQPTDRAATGGADRAVTDRRRPAKARARLGYEPIVSIQAGLRMMGAPPQ